MLRVRSAVTVLLVSLFLLVISTPAFAEHPWIDGHGKKGANHTLTAYPWIDGSGYRQGGANHMPGESPWCDGNGKCGANHSPSEHGWSEGNGNCSDHHNTSAVAFLQHCWRLFYR